MRLLAKVREKAGRIEESISTLNEAKENQLRYVQRTTMLSNSEDPISLSADICFEIAEHATAVRDFKLALNNYKEVLKYKPEDVKALLSLSKLYMQVWWNSRFVINIFKLSKFLVDERFGKVHNVLHKSPDSRTE